MKKIGSLAVVVLGVFLIGYGIYSKNHISRAEVEFHKMAESKNSIVKSVGHEMEKKIGSHHTKMKFFLAAGSILVLVGLCGAYYYKKK